MPTIFFFVLFPSLHSSDIGRKYQTERKKDQGELITDAQLCRGSFHQICQSPGTNTPCGERNGGRKLGLPALAGLIRRLQGTHLKTPADIATGDR